MKLGTWSLVPSPHLVELLAKGGFDFCILDAEHGGIGLASTLVSLVRAADAARIDAFVRVPYAREE